MFTTILFFFFSLLSLSTQQKNPLKDFCRLFGHSTTVVDRKLYIDGGLVNWSPISPTSLNYSSTWLKNGNLDEDHEGFPQEYILAKNETVPSVHGGILWSDAANKIIYQYGGEYGNGQPEDFKLWFYDIIYGTWNISNASVTGTNRASWGAGAVNQDKARGYYYGGWLTDASVPGYTSSTALSNMLVFDMIGNTFRNETGPDTVPRAEGSMVYLPVGESGLLVYFGGVQLPYENSTVTGVPMSEIHMYDVSSGRWYTETASGDVPDQRRRFCAGATWAKDRSSYNIYLYGGASINEGSGFGDTYILSLPSFTWIKFWPREEDDAGQPFPHHSLTCEVINNSQMIIMGGTFPNSSTCDAEKVFGQHGLSLGKDNIDGSKWNLFNASLTTYQVPPEITKTIGGDASGGATLLAPTGGFQERDIKNQFLRAYTPTSRTATRFIPTATKLATSPSSTSTSTSTPTKSNKTPLIAGAVGGAVGGLILIAFIVCWLLLYRRRCAQKDPIQPKSIPELPTPTQPPELDTYPGKLLHTPTTPQYAHTPHGSPPLDHTWSTSYDGHDVAPEYPRNGHTMFAAPVPMHPPYEHEHQRSYSGQTHEMPIVRSPEPVNVQGYGGNVQRDMQHLGSSPVQYIDPYYAQHPPSPPVGGPPHAAGRY